MSKINWKVGEFAKRVSKKALSSMPMGYVGEVTGVDHEDINQPICIDYQFWPFIVDIERVAQPVSETK